MTAWCKCGHADDEHDLGWMQCYLRGCQCKHFEDQRTREQIAVERVEELVAWAKDNYMRQIDTNDVIRALRGDS